MQRVVIGIRDSMARAIVHMHGILSNIKEKLRYAGHAAREARAPRNRSIVSNVQPIFTSQRSIVSIFTPGSRFILALLFIKTRRWYLWYVCLDLK